MSNFNSDFKDLLDTIVPYINKKMKTFSLVSLLNGYYEDRNDTYMIGYRLNGKEFPVVVTLKMHFPWSFHEWTGKSVNAETYNEIADELGGGFLTFEKEFHFELLIDTNLFSAYNSMSDFDAEPLEFENIKSEKFTLDLTHKEKNIVKFTKAETKQIMKWFGEAVPKLMERVEPAIEAQVVRRFEEIMKANETLALKYAPDSVKDMFIF